MNPLPASWMAALHRRAALLPHEPCIRLLHQEVAQLRCDRFGAVCWGYWYGDGDPGTSMLGHLETLCQQVGAEHWHLHGMNDRGRDPHQRRHWSSPAAPMQWIAEEQPLRLCLSAERGQSPGLFLDQRHNRRWVHAHSNGRRIANLFAYTGAFGVAAAAGDATEVVQVDVSRSYLEWAEENARLNDIGGSIEYAAVDARLFLRGCSRRERRFDGIICDPPSFARGRKRGEPAFRIVDDLPELIRLAFDVLSDDGWLLVTTNHEGWTTAQMEGCLRRIGPGHIVSTPQTGPDFEAPGEEPLLKGFLLRP